MDVSGVGDEILVKSQLLYHTLIADSHFAASISIQIPTVWVPAKMSPLNPMFIYIYIYI